MSPELPVILEFEKTLIAQKISKKMYKPRRARPVFFFARENQKCLWNVFLAFF